MMKLYKKVHHKSSRLQYSFCWVEMGRLKSWKKFQRISHVWRVPSQRRTKMRFGHNETILKFFPSFWQLDTSHIDTWLTAREFRTKNWKTFKHSALDGTVFLLVWRKKDTHRNHFVGGTVNHLIKFKDESWWNRTWRIVRWRGRFFFALVFDVHCFQFSLRIVVLWNMLDDFLLAFALEVARARSAQKTSVGLSIFCTWYADFRRFSAESWVWDWVSAPASCFPKFTYEN